MAFSQDEMLNIFSWLPAKSICKFKCCHKSFSEFSAETYFAMMQAQNSFMKDDPCLFIQRSTNQRYVDIIEIHQLAGKDSSSGVPAFFLQHLADNSKILSSSNGLLLCRSVDKNKPLELFICNPATQLSLTIPTPKYLKKNPDADIHAAFECNYGSLDPDDYKLFLIQNPTNWFLFECQIYLPKEGVWKVTERKFFTGSRDMKFHMPVFHKGAIHFISDSYPYIIRESTFFRPYIMAYDHESCMSRMIRVPNDAKRGSHDHSCNMGIFKWGKVKNSDESICLVRLRKYVFTVWVLMDYEKNSWKRILKIRVRAILGFLKEDCSVIGFRVMNGDTLIFATKEKVYGYGLVGENFGILEEICDNRFESNVVFISYSNTLRPCGFGATTMMP